MEKHKKTLGRIIYKIRCTECKRSYKAHKWSRFNNKFQPDDRCQGMITNGHLVQHFQENGMPMYKCQICNGDLEAYHFVVDESGKPVKLKEDNT